MLIFVRETTLNKKQWRQILTPKTPIDLTLNRTRIITEISNMKKETVRLLLAPTGWICLELLNLLLVQTGMKYPDLTEIGKGAMITTRKASDIAWKSKAVYRFLRSPPQPDTLSYKHEKLLEVGLSPQKRLQGFFALQYL